MKKRILSLLLCIVMCLSLMPMTVFASGTGKTLPYSFDFETDMVAEGWTNIDADGDGQDWISGTNKYGDEGWGVAGSRCAISQSYENENEQAFDADNWLFSPAITIPEGGATVSWYEQSRDPDFPDFYEVYVSETNTEIDLSKMTLIFDGFAANPWMPRSVELEAAEYAGKTVYIAFRHHCLNKYMLNIDDFAVEAVAPAHTHTVTFDANGGSVTPTSAETGTDGKLATLPTPTRSGSYSFDGWYTMKEGGTKVDTNTVFTAAATIYAHWSWSFSFAALPETGVAGITVPEGDYYTGVAAKDAFILYWDENIKTDGDFILIDYFYTYNNGYHSWMITIENGVPVATDGGFTDLDTLLDTINNEPFYASWDKWVNGTYTADTAVTEYDVWVDGVRVTSANKGNILDASGTPTATYDPESKTLTLNGYDGSSIVADTALNIVLADGTENTVSVPVDVGGCGISTKGDCTLSGKGDLDIHSPGDGIWADDGDLTINMSGDLSVSSSDSSGLSSNGYITISGSGNIVIDAKRFGLWPNPYKDVILSGSGALSVTAAQNAVYLNGSGKSLLLNGTGAPISLKSGTGKAAVWNSADSNSPVGGTNIANYTVTGAPDTASVVYTLKSTEYNLWVSGVQVTSANKDNILGDSGTPTATYDPDTKTLTLNNATITDVYNNGYNAAAAVYSVDSLKVILKGSNTVSLESDDAGYGFYTQLGSLTLTGDGSLNITIDNSDYDGILSSGSLVVNMGGNLIVNAARNGIHTNSAFFCSGNGNVTIKASNEGICAEHNGIELSGSGNINISGGKDVINTLQGNIRFSGSGKVTVTATNGHAVYTESGDVFLSGSGEVSITSNSRDAVFLRGTNSKVLLNGTGSPISLTAGSGYKAVLNDAGESPVGGTNLANYTVTGAPDEQSVVYTLKCSHTPVTITGKVATCTEDGWKDYYECSLCHKYFEDNACEAEIADLGAWKAAGGNGYIAPTGHGETEIRDAKEATCTEAGFTGDTYCKICGDKIDDGTAIDVKAHTYGEWATTKDPTLTEKGMKERSCTACGDKQTEELPVLTPVTYSIISGANGEWTKGSTSGLAFTSDAPFAKFGSVKVDGSTIAAANYTAVEGSTKITLTSAYLETLSVGSHSIEVVSNDGTASASFTVKAAAQPSVPTTYTVSFDMNGHGAQISAQSVESGSKAIKPADPKASGYTFGGWYADATCSTKFDFNSAITANTTVYAKWTKTSVAPADPTSPQTGDTSDMFLWIALLLVSGGALVGTTVYGKKRKRAE